MPNKIYPRAIPALMALIILLALVSSTALHTAPDDSGSAYGHNSGLPVPALDGTITGSSRTYDYSPDNVLPDGAAGGPVSPDGPLVLPTVGFGTGSVTLREGTNGSVDVVLDNASDTDVTVRVSTSDGTAHAGTNYQPFSREVTIPAGSLSQSVSIATLKDQAYSNPDLFFVLNLGVVSGNATAGTSAATVYLDEADTAPSVSWASTTATVPEGTNGSLELRLSEASTSDVVVAVASSDGTALAGRDYLPADDQYTFHPGTTGLSVQVATLDNDIFCTNDLYFGLNLSIAGGNATIGSGDDVVHVAEASLPPTVSWQPASTIIPEGTNGSLELQLSEVSDANVTVSVLSADGTALAGRDYAPVNDQYVICAGQSNVTVPLETLNNHMYSSPDLHFNLTMSIADGNATASTDPANVEIREADAVPTVGWAVASTDISEGSPGAVDVQLSEPATYDVTVSVASVNGTALAGKNFVAVGEQYVIRAGTRSIEVPITTLDNGMYDSPNLTFSMALGVVSGPAVAGTTNLTVNVTETRPEPTFSLSSDAIAISEGSSGQIGLQLSGPASSNVTVLVTTADGTAHAGANYAPISEQFVILPNTTLAMVTIDTLDDRMYSSPDLQFGINATVVDGPATGNGSAGVTINEKNATPSLGWQSGSASVPEGNSGSLLAVMSGPATSNVTFNVTTGNGTALAGVNYVPISDVQYVIPAGQTSVSVPVATLDDGLYGWQNGTFAVNISQVSGPATAGLATATVEIGEISSRPTAGWQATALNVTEGTTVTEDLVLSNPASSNVTFNVTTGNGTALAGVNYVPISDVQYVIPAGQTSVSVSVATIDDHMYSSPDLQFTAGLAAVSGPATPVNATLTVDLGEVSSRPQVGLAGGVTAITENTTGSIDVQLTGPATSNVTVAILTGDGTGHAGINYDVISRQYVIPAGSTGIHVPVTTLDDGKYSDPALSFYVNLSLVSGPADEGTASDLVNITEISPRPTLSWKNATLTIPEGTTQDMVALISGLTTSNVTINVVTGNGTANASVDYTPISQDFTIPAGSTGVNVPVTTLDDGMYSSPDLQFGISATVVGGPASGSAASTIAVGEADTQPTVSWQSSTALVPEGQSGAISIQMSEPVRSAVVVHATTSDGTARTSTNYLPVDSDFTIPAGAANISVPVTTVNDGKYSSPNLTFRMTLSVVSGTVSPGTILQTTVSVGEASPEPTVTWLNQTTTIAEGTTMPVLASLSGPSTSDVVLKVITSDGTGHVGIDYNAIGQRFTIPAGSTSVSIPITTLNDNMYSDPNLTFGTTLSVYSGPAIAANPTATVIIGDCNATPRVSFSTGSTSIGEGNSGSITIKQDGVATSDVIVSVSTVNNTAVAGTNFYAITAQNFTIPAGSTSVTVPVTTINDGKYSSPSLTFSLALNVVDGPAVNGATPTIVITDTEASPRPTVAMAYSAVQIPEGLAGYANVSLTAPSTSDTTVSILTSDITARAGTNYAPISVQDYTIPAGALSVAVSVTTLNDYMYSSPNLTFNVTMSLVSGVASVGTKNTTVTIGEANATPVVTFSGATTDIAEGKTGALYLNLSGRATSDVKVVVATADGTAREGYNFNAIGKYFTIPAGSTGVAVPVTTVDDGLFCDPSLQFNASLVSVSGPAAIGTPSATVVVIDEASPRPTVGWQWPTASIREGSTARPLIQLSNPADQDTVVSVTTGDGTAIAGTDYTAISGVNYTIPAGSTNVSVPVVTLSNGGNSNGHQFTVNLSVVSGPAAIGQASLNASIYDTTGGTAGLNSGSALVPEGTITWINVTLSDVASSDVVIHGKSGNGTARAGIDFAPIDQDFTVKAGTSNVSVPVTTYDDGMFSYPDLAFGIAFNVVSGPASGSSSWTVTIDEASPVPTLGFNVSTIDIPEGTTGPAAINLSCPATFDVDMIVATTAGTAQEGLNYEAIGQRYTIPAGSTGIEVPVTTVDNAMFSDPNLTFTIGLTLLNGTVVIGNGSSTVVINESSPRPTVGWPSSSIAIGEGVNNTVSLQLSGPMTSPAVVSVTTSDGTAIAGLNYTAISGQQYTIPAGATSVPVYFVTQNDHVYDSPALKFNATVSLVSGPESPGTATTTLNVNDANGKPSVRFNTSTLAIPEGQTGAIIVQLSGAASADVTVRLTTSDVTAVAGTNYVAIAQNYTIPAGFTSVTIPIVTLNDSNYSSPDLQFGLGVSVAAGPASGTASATVVINESSPRPTVTWAAGPAIITEGTTGYIYPVLSGPSTSDVSVIVKTSDGTGRAGVDYNTVGRRFTIPAGSTTVAVPVTTLDDNKYSRPNLTFNANLTLYSGPAILLPSDISVQIGEENATPAVSLSAGSLAIPEGSGGSLKVQISGVTTTDVTVHAYTINGTATAGNNFIAIDQNITIAAGQTSVTVPITTINDNKYSSPDQSFTLEADYAGGPATGNATAVVTITEANVTPRLSWQNASAFIPEGTNGSLVVQMSGPATTDVVVHVTTSDGTAASGIEYAAVGQDFTIPAGATNVTVPVATIDDHMYSDPDLTFNASFSLASGPATGNGTAGVTIVEASARPLINWETGTLPIPEGTNGSINVTLSGPATSAVVVSVATADGTAHASTNYQTISRQFTIPAGTTSLSVPVATLDDGLYSSPNLTFALNLIYVSGPASAGTLLASTAEIGELSPRPSVSWQSGAMAVPESQTRTNYLVLTGGSTSAVVVNVTTSDGTAFAGVNYNKISQNYTFAPGTVSVPVTFTTINDNKYSDPDLTFNASFSLASGPVAVGSNSTGVTIGEASARPTVQWQSATGSITEGTTGPVNLQMSGPATSDVVVDVSTGDLTAAAGTNYQAVSQQYIIPAGSVTKAVNITTINDNKYSNPSLQFYALMSYVSGPASQGGPYNTTVTINESSARPTVTWQNGSMTVMEANSSADTLVLSGLTTSDVTVKVTTTNVTALAGINYVPISQNFTIAAGTNNTTVPVAMLNDNKYSNPNQTFSLGLSVVGGPASGSSSATMTVGEILPKPTVNWETTAINVPEGQSNVINVTLSGPATTPVQVKVLTTNITARYGVNYNRINSQTYTIAAGATSTPVTVQTTNDYKYSNPNLTFSLGLSYYSGPASAGTQLTATATINDTSVTPTLGWQNTSSLIPEATSGSVTLQLSGPLTSDVVVNVSTSDGTAVAGTDYTAISSQQFAIYNGTTSLAVPVTTLDNHKYSSPNLTFNVSFGLVSGPVSLVNQTTNVSVGEKSPKPTLSWQTTTPSIAEGTNGSVVLQLSGATTSDVVVNVSTADRTAVADTNYVPFSQQFTILNGTTSLAIPVQTINNYEYSDPNLTFNVSFSLVSGPVNAGSPNATVSIGEANQTPTLGWQPGSLEIPEGSPGSLTLQLSGPLTSDVVARVNTTNGTAHAGTDFVAISSQIVTIYAGTTNVSVPVQTCDDSKYSSPNLTFNVSFVLVSGPVNVGSQNATIDLGEMSPRPTVSWQDASLSVPEGSPGSLTLQLSGPATSNVTVAVTTTNGTARSGINYAAVGQSFNITAGNTSVSVPVQTLNDYMYSNPNLTFNVSFGVASGPADGSGIANVTINETNQTPTLGWQSGSALIPEGQGSSLVLKLSGASTSDVVVNVSTVNGTAYAGTNYVPNNSRQFTILNGSTMVSVPVSTINDYRYSNPNLTFNVSFCLVSGPVDTGLSNETVSIGEANVTPALGWQSGSALIPEGTGGSVLLQLSGPSTSDVVVNVSTVNGTAYAGTNYVPFSQQLIIYNGSTNVSVPLSTINDYRYSNPNLTFNVSFSLASGPVSVGAVNETVAIGEANVTPTVSWQDASLLIPEGSPGSLTLQMSSPATSDVVLNVTTANVTAFAGVNYVPVTRNYTIPAGATSVSVSLSTYDDHRYSDPNLTYNISFSLASGPATGNGTAGVTIGEASSRPTVGWASDALPVHEGTGGSVNLTLSGPATSAVTVNVTTVNGTAGSGTNYVAIGRQYVIPAGSINVTVPVETMDDGQYSRPDLAFTINISAIAGPASPGTTNLTVTISEASLEPTVTWHPGPAAVPEGSDGSLDLELSGPATSDVVLNVTTGNGTAHAGIDYAAVDGQYTIPAGKTSVTVSLSTYDDHLYSSPDLAFWLNFSLASGTATAAGTSKMITITEADAMPSVSLLPDSLSIPEGQADQLTLHLSEPVTSDVTVNVTTSNGTAGAGVNFVAIGGNYTIPAGSSNATVPVTTLDDHKFSSPDLTFNVSFSPVSGPVTQGNATSAVVIAEASGRPTVSWPWDNVTIHEGSTVPVTVQLSSPATTPVIVNVTTVDGTARAGTNYEPVSRDLTIPAGATGVSLDVATLDDHMYSDPDLCFNLSLRYVSGPAQGSDNATVIVGEANATPAIGLNRTYMLIPEGNDDAINVTLSGPATTDVVVNLTTMNDTALAGINYEAISRNYTIPAGATAITVPLATLDDNKYSRPDLTFAICLAMASGPAAGGANATVEIGETNATPTVSWQPDATLLQENTTGSLDLVLSGLATTPVTVNVTTVDGNATAGTSYAAIGRNFTIPADTYNVTVPIVTLDDDMYSNPNQTFNLTMHVCAGPAEGSGNATVEIGEMDPAPTLSWQLHTVDMAEGSTGDLVVALSEPTTFNVTFNVTTTDGTARSGRNYMAMSRQFTILAGKKSIAIPVTLLNDGTYSSTDNQFTVTLEPVNGTAVNVTQPTAAVVITEVSSPPTPVPTLAPGATPTLTPAATPTPTAGPGGEHTGLPAPSQSAGWWHSYCYCCVCLVPVALALLALLLYRRRKDDKEKKE